MGTVPRRVLWLGAMQVPYTRAVTRATILQEPLRHTNLGQVLASDGPRELEPILARPEEAQAHAAAPDAVLVVAAVQADVVAIDEPVLALEDHLLVALPALVQQVAARLGH